jgi:uncharacterized membrane protein HdeD (DUF308 family)
MTQQIGTSKPPAVAVRREDTLSHALLGLAGAGVATLALLHPTQTTFLIAAFAAFAFIAGAIALAFGVRRVMTTRHGWGMILEGLGGILVGVIIFRVVHSLLYLVWTLSGWAAAIGAIVTIFAIVLRAQLPEAGLWLAGGLIMLALGIVLFIATNAGFTASGFLLGIFAGVYALVQFVLAFRHAQS